MSTGTAIANQEQARGLAAYSTEQVNLLKRTICRGATDDEFSLFMAVVNKTGLDPFSRQIHAVKRWDAREKREVMSIQTGIDGYRLIAQRSGDLNGQDGPYWCGPDGKWKDVWLESAPPAAAKVIVYRKGCAHPFVGIARYEAYVQRDKEGNPNRMWRTMADGQLAKCAESLALRKAFPAELSGVYTQDEMGQAESPPIEKPVNAEPAPAAIPAPEIPERFQKDYDQLVDTLGKVQGDLDKIGNIQAWWGKRKGKMPHDLWETGDGLCQDAARACVDSQTGEFTSQEEQPPAA